MLLPGLLLPLHVFEERYRRAGAATCSALPEDERRFGVVAIRQGREVGADGVRRALHEVGCVARVRRVEAYDDGRFDLVATGARALPADRRSTDGGRTSPGSVELLPDEPGRPEEARCARRAVRRGLRAAT